MQAEARPDWSQAAELLAAGEPVAAVHSFCLSRGEQDRNIVAAFRMSSRENLARSGLAQEPLQRVIAAAPQIGGNAYPIQMHVHGQGGGWSVIGEPPLLAANLGEVH